MKVPPSILLDDKLHDDIIGNISKSSSISYEGYVQDEIKEI